MAGFAQWQIEPALVAGLERLGWRDDEPAVRDVMPAVVRGANLVVVLPPAPAWAGPIMTALLGRLSPIGPVLVLTAPALVGEWAIAAGALTESAPRRIGVARELRGVAPRGDTSPHDVLIASPATALDRHAHSALHPEQFRAVMFAWPEEWHADAAVTALLQDIPRDAQRIVLASRAETIDGADGVVERYARRALVLHSAGNAAAIAAMPRISSVRTVAASWTGRASAVARVVESMDRPEVTIWTADRRDHQLIQRALGSLRDGIRLAIRAVPDAGLIICYDPPTAPQLAELSAAGEVVLIVPPGCEPYVRAVAPMRRPLELDSPASERFDRDAALRADLTAVIESADESAALYVLAPLFERFDPQLVAAAAFGLWRGAVRGGGTQGPAAPSRSGYARAAPDVPGEPAHAVPPPAAGSGTAKLWIGAGKKDEATVGDFVAVLIKEAGMDRSRIGRIELRDTFALVEVPADDAEGIAQRLVGLTIRKRKLSARVDRGRGGGSGRTRG
ncbi:MAG: DbpA RNA binding domain-containing protein [Gemmatimonadales bacterium]